MKKPQYKGQHTFRTTDFEFKFKKQTYIIREEDDGDFQPTLTYYKCNSKGRTEIPESKIPTEVIELFDELAEKGELYE